MKKTITTLLLLFLTFGVFAETGYNNTKWGKKRELLNFGENADDWEIENLQMVSFSTIVLGDQTIKTYFFDKEEGLNCVSYYIPEDSVSELLTKFDPKKKVYKIRTRMFDLEEITEVTVNLIESKKVPTFYDGTDEAISALMIIICETYMYELASISEDKGYKSNKATEAGPGIGTLYIYDYNDDTRVYIAAGNVEGFAFVAYVPHFKDY